MRNGRVRRQGSVSMLRVWGATVGAVALAGVAVGQISPCPPASLEAATLPMDCGESVVTCFSGFLGDIPSRGFDLDAPVLALVDTRTPPPTTTAGRHWCADMFHNIAAPAAHRWTAQNLGQVFGVTIDDANPPNIYVAASSVYGSDNPAYLPAGLTLPFLSTPFGPGGAGAVYRIHGVTGNINVFVSLPNAGPGLGNLSYDAGSRTFFISNLDDGRIYCVKDPALTGTGTVVATFNHATGVIAAGVPGGAADGVFAPLGERPWAVKAHNGRLYYSIWVEDAARRNAARANEIWSISIADPSLCFQGTARLEVQMPPYPGPFYFTSASWSPGTVSSNPVSDITFSATGRMMAAERVMRGDVGMSNHIGDTSRIGQYAHSARNLEFELIGSSWQPTVSASRQFNIGVTPGVPGSNAAGGVDYLCDELLVSTGDYILRTDSPAPNIAYGLQITPAAGNAPNTAASIRGSGRFIDLNNEYTTADKTLVGDVACFRDCCECAEVDWCFIKREIIEGQPTNCYEVELGFVNRSGRTVHYILFPGGQVTPSGQAINPPIPPGGSTGINPVRFKICGVTPGTIHRLEVILADIEGDECCRFIKDLEILSEDDCFQFDSPPIQAGDFGASSFNWYLPITPMQFDMGHVFIVYEPAPGTSYTVTITPDYYFFGFPVPQYSTATTIFPYVSSNAPPGTTLCFRIFIHHPDFDPCCSEVVCATIPIFPFAITQPPIDTTSCPGGTATFSIGVSSAGPVEFLWRKDGVPLLDGGCYSGCRTQVLTVAPVVGTAEGEYDCVVSGPEGSLISDPATLTVCLADLDCDGVVDFSDYLAFLNLYDSGDPLADINGDGVVDFADYLEFLNEFTAGC